MVFLRTETIIICTGKLEIQIKMEKISPSYWDIFDFIKPALSSSVKDPLEIPKMAAM